MKLPIVVTATVLLLSGYCGMARAQADLSGMWMPDRSPEFERMPFPRGGNLPYTEYGRQLQDAFLAEFDPQEDQPAFFCVQPGMPMSMSPAAPFPLEVIQRGHDVTMFFEAWSQYRKIYIEGFDRPEAILHTRMGYSVGHWEGETLVVEVTHLAERTMGRELVSEEATFTERLHVETGKDGKRRLISDIVYTDPVIYTQPINVRGVWVESPDTMMMEYSCSDALYDQHIERVRQGRQ